MADDQDGTTSSSIVELNQDKFHQTQAQLEEIANQIKREQPLTSEKAPLETLRTHYETGSQFDLGVSVLARDYDWIRTVRGDGNCYYRAFLFSLCEALFRARRPEQERIKDLVERSAWRVVQEGGYDEIAIEIFHESLVELVFSIVEGGTTLETVYRDLLEENSTSDYCTWFLRVLTATQLKSDPNRFLPYLEDGYVDIHTFCQTQVEPMAVECTMVSVLALAEAFDVQVKIEYLDGHEIRNAKLQQHQFGRDNAETSLTLLYRPGHYDILYPKQ